MARNLRDVCIVSVVEGTIPDFKNSKKVVIRKDSSNTNKTASPTENKVISPLLAPSTEKDSEASELLSEFELEDANITIEYEFKCQFCDEVLSSKQGLNEHWDTHAELRPHQCNVCRMRFNIRSNLLWHQRKHAQINTCKICGKKVKGSFQFRRHVFSHPSTKPFPCPVCNELFATTDDLAQHTISGDNPGCCNVCSRKFCHSKDLEKHKKVHEKKFECKLCNLKLATKQNLKIHMFKHTGELPYPCTFCTKSFKCLSYLKDHVRIHTGEKPYVCDTCGMGFQYSQSLKYHEQMKHVTDLTNQFECAICGKRFKTRACVSRHMKSHKPKQYPCDVCDKMFSQKGSVAKHKRNVHKLNLNPKIPECQPIEAPGFSSLIHNM